MMDCTVLSYDTEAATQSEVLIKEGVPCPHPPQPLNPILGQAELF